MKRRVIGMCGDHPGYQTFDAFDAGCLLVSKPQRREHVVKMTPQDCFYQRQFVGKVLVQRPDADTCHFGYCIGGESPPALTVEDASSGLQDCLHGCASPLLSRFFSHSSCAIIRAAEVTLPCEYEAYARICSGSCLEPDPLQIVSPNSLPSLLRDIHTLHTPASGPNLDGCRFPFFKMLRLTSWKKRHWRRSASAILLNSGNSRKHPWWGGGDKAPSLRKAKPCFGLAITSCPAGVTARPRPWRSVRS